MPHQSSYGTQRARWPHVIALGAIAVLACALYLPFVGNPLVFDDQVFFSGTDFAYYATHPIGFGARLPGYFTLAFAEVMWSRIEAHRVISLVLHLACAVILYLWICRLQRAVRSENVIAGSRDDEWRTAACALLGAGAFAMHPVAVYAAGYLVQRSLVVATLFALLSLHLLSCGLTRERVGITLAAALCYALSVMSKEHAILLPAVALPMAVLLGVRPRARMRQLALYLAACAPVALWILFMRRQLVGHAYEPHIDALAGPLDPVGVPLSWALSAVNQLGLFFSYLGAWLLPDIRDMAIDLRIDVFAAWSPERIALRLASFAAFGALGGALVWRKGRGALLGLGMLYAWLLYFVEFSVLRFQEPFVLYRSYLWAPGLALGVAALLGTVSHRVTFAAFAAAIPFLLYQAHDRLVTFSSPLLLWEDAAAKLPRRPVQWGSRILYNLGGAYLRSDQPGKAAEVIDRCVATYPTTDHCLIARGAIHIRAGEYEQALSRFRRAAEIDPKSGVTQHRIGIALERLGQLEAAKERYRAAAALGYQGGDMELSRFGELGGTRAGPEKKTAP